jgi:hypothetical protein
MHTARKFAAELVIVTADYYVTIGQGSRRNVVESPPRAALGVLRLAFA